MPWPMHAVINRVVAALGSVPWHDSFDTFILYKEKRVLLAEASVILSVRTTLV